MSHVYSSTPRWPCVGGPHPYHTLLQRVYMLLLTHNNGAPYYYSCACISCICTHEYYHQYYNNVFALRLYLY